MIEIFYLDAKTPSLNEILTRIVIVVKVSFFILYSAYSQLITSYLKHCTILTHNFPVQALSTVSFLCEGEPPPPISTPWGAYRP